MATKKKLLQAAAGNAGDAALDVDDVFSTYLYDGNGSTQTITNEIDLDGEGGLVWVKERNNAESHQLFDTERGNTKVLSTDSISAEGTVTTRVTGFNSNGFSLGSNASVNQSSAGYASWSFLKSKRFFDVVTWTGDGTSSRAIAHDLDSSVGSVIIKRLDATEAWYVWHRGYPSGSLKLNEDSAGLSFGLNQYFGGTQPTSSNFYVSSDSGVNNNGSTYVAYLFAHNNNDGEFGPDSDQDIIKCGSYSGTGNYQEIDLGFEAQWVMIKRTDSSQDWMIFDVMRGMPDQGGTGSTPSGNDARLKPNTSDAEQSDTYGIDPHANGFAVRGNNISVNGSTYIYIAIRRGPLAPPESATDVFNETFQYSEDGKTAGYLGNPADLDIRIDKTGGGSLVRDRLRGDVYLKTQATDAEAGSQSATWDNMTGYFYYPSGTSANTNIIHYVFRRAPSYMDVVAYTGNGTAGRTVSHNLGVAPEMMWVKQRPYSSDWRVYHSALGNTKVLVLNSTAASATLTSAWNSTTPSSTVFTLGSSNDVNENPLAHIAYLFASLAGISKVGSVTHSGTTNVDCGFSSGARFVLLKRTDAAGDWYVWDSERGIVSGNDPYLLLNTTAAEVTNTDYIDPLSSGFTITSSFTAGDYIFYAIA